MFYLLQFLLRKCFYPSSKPNSFVSSKFAFFPTLQLRFDFTIQLISLFPSYKLSTIWLQDARGHCTLLICAQNMSECPDLDMSELKYRFLRFFRNHSRSWTRPPAECFTVKNLVTMPPHVLCLPHCDVNSVNYLTSLSDMITVLVHFQRLWRLPFWVIA